MLLGDDVECHDTSAMDPGHAMERGTMKLMRTKEAAQMLGTSPYQVRQLLQRGDVPGAKIGRQWRVDLDALREKMSGGGRANPAAAKQQVEKATT